MAAYRAEMAPTLPLSRHIFAAPTFYYKTGIAFLAWLSGHQDGFTMVGGLQAARSPVHLARVFELANTARLLPDPELAAHRLGLVLDAAGMRPTEPAVAQPEDHRLLVTARRRSTAAWPPGCRASGSGANRWRGRCRERPEVAGRRGAAGLLTVPGRVLHRRRSGAGRGGARREPARHRRGGRHRCGHPLPGARWPPGRGPRSGRCPVPCGGRDRTAGAVRPRTRRHVSGSSR